VVNKYLDFCLLYWSNSYTLVGKHEGKSYSGDLDVDGSIILKRIFKRYCIRVFTGLI
jgi:hypothetical protein